MLIVVGILLAFIVTYLVLDDANGRDWSGRAIKPLAWGFLTLMFWPLFAPLYLARRPRA